MHCTPLEISSRLESRAWRGKRGGERGEGKWKGKREETQWGEGGDMCKRVTTWNRHMSPSSLSPHFSSPTSSSIHQSTITLRNPIWAFNRRMTLLHVTKILLITLFLHAWECLGMRQLQQSPVPQYTYERVMWNSNCPWNWSWILFGEDDAQTAYRYHSVHINVTCSSGFHTGF